MGRGSRAKDEPRKLSRAKNLRTAALEGEAGGGEGAGTPERSPCEATKTLAALFAVPSTVKQGDPVRLRLGIPPAVLVRGIEVGHIEEPDASTAEGCLLEGFVLTGSVRSIDPFSGKGTVLVAGRK
jgi:hypothetical protein